MNNSTSRKRRIQDHDESEAPSLKDAKIINPTSIYNGVEIASNERVVFDSAKFPSIFPLELTVEKPRIRKRVSLKDLPDSVLIKILGNLNQIDAISLSLTSKRFKEVTRTRLYSTIYVYFGQKRLIPKDYYVSHYTDFTHIQMENFERMIEEKVKLPSCKAIFFPNDKFLGVSYLQMVSNAFPGSQVVLRRYWKDNVQRWMFNCPDNPFITMHHLLGPTTKKDPTREHVRDLIVTRHPDIDYSYELKKYPNLRSLYLEHIQSLEGLPKISAREVKIRQLSSFDIYDFCGCFDVAKITSLDLSKVSEEIVKIAPRFKSLRKLYITHDASIMCRFAQALPKDSLTYLSVPARSIDSFQVEALRHAGSLRIISASPYFQSIVPKEPSKAKEKVKQLEWNLFRFSKLEFVIFDREALRVFRRDETPRFEFVPVEFHPTICPY
ncbi:uncharacterized protein J8A68_000292 [[Candida] subhashii]|uniref:F-box domain-containing protein n=1 Tax=[Candida] subhashii TaxID=561895 RepID=A0A8J5QRG8_9ASCO|nr:uncharacterized protein J8A68_000292 [[Candida] subhashii]KAG7666163.1 hypothetical protein J8A68_000292 [[Candida] subhashii]